MTGELAGPADLLVVGGTVVTIAGDNLEGGAVAVRDGQIVAVGAADQVSTHFSAAETVDARGGVILPGLVNAHTHAPMSLFRGIADDRELMDWLENYIFPAEARFVDAEFVRWGMRLAAAEMIRSGTTTFADMYFFEEEIAEVARETGMRAVLSQALLDFPAPDSGSWEETIERCRRFVERFHGDPLITPSLGPHAPYTVSGPHLEEARQLATELRVPLLIHLSETREELRRVAELSGGLTPGAYLDSLGFLGPDVVVMHGVWLSPDEIATLAARGTSVVYNPESNMMLSSGVAPVPDLLAAGVKVGLGTDGPAGSNNDVDMFGEMASATRLQKVTRSPTALGARQVLEMATMGGARALGLEHRIGSIEVGKRADLIVVDLAAPHLQPVYSIESALVYSARGSDVVTTIVDGRVLMRDRDLLTIDEPAVLAKAREYRNRVADSLGF